MQLEPDQRLHLPAQQSETSRDYCDCLPMFLPHLPRNGEVNPVSALSEYRTAWLNPDERLLTANSGHSMIIAEVRPAHHCIESSIGESVLLAQAIDESGELNPIR